MNLTQRFGSLRKKLFADITELPAVFEHSHLPGLDGLRGVSILTVIASHFAMYTPFTNYISGDVGVETFFVISGFLITTLLLKEKVKRGAVLFTNFYIRRILRIIPVAYLFVLVLALLNKPLHLDIPTFSFWASLFFVKNIPISAYQDWYTGHFWSLSVEEQFYVYFPFFIVTRTNKFIVGAVIIILAVPALTLLGFSDVALFSNHIVHVITFIIIILLGRGTIGILVGALFSILLFKKIIVVDRLKNNYFLSFVLLIAAYITLTPRSGLSVPYLSAILFPVLIGYVILLNLKEKNLLRWFLDRAVLTEIGVLSYSLYVWQELFTSTQAWHFFKYSDSIPVRAVLLFITAWLSYYFYERFFLRYKTKFKAG